MTKKTNPLDAFHIGQLVDVNADTASGKRWIVGTVIRKSTRLHVEFPPPATGHMAYEPARIRNGDILPHDEARATLRVQHDPTRSPFPITQGTGANITDERCRCGGLRSAHENTISFGHGRMLVRGHVVCERFSWVGWVFTSVLLRGREALDDKRAVEMARAIGGDGHTYKVFDMSASSHGKCLFTCRANGDREYTKRHAATELRLHLERVAKAISTGAPQS